MAIQKLNITEYLNKIDKVLETADKKRTFDDGLNIAREIMGLFGLENIQAELKGYKRLKDNPAWTKNAPDFEDRKASYVLAENNDRNIDFKFYWVNKASKKIISNLVALTPNFEDEPFYSNKNIGIDFALSENADRLIIVLSNSYKIRILEINRRLSNTQKKIFEKWAQEFDFSNKAQVHKILWDSFDIQPLNRDFYIEISGFFNELVQHFEKNNILDKKHRAQYVNRLIGRIIFCWFLRKKEIISEEPNYFDYNSSPQSGRGQGEGDYSSTEYYKAKLETLFFKVLNTPIEERASDVENKTPFLNGGLFEEKETDISVREKLSFPSDYFKRFYEFLKHYNFTTDESTSDFQQVAIDPEMLGRIFENLLAEEIEETGEQARKAKGAFYTPREIVDYMCKESLKAYISEKLNSPSPLVGEVRRGGELTDEIIKLLFEKKEHEIDPKNTWSGLSSQKEKIMRALDEIKIIDPACGSGAFPIGMLQIMLSIYERLDSRLDHYKTKLDIIKNNIFGVDIEPMAVEISRLRTWLSLVVYSTIKPNEKNKGIEELPNLDFKFVCANSLIPLPTKDEAELFDTVNAKELIEIREKYFNARTRKSKEELHKKYDKKIEYKKDGNLLASQREKQLRTYHPFEADNICEFFDSQFMFGVEGFDIVIGNPPYVQLQKDHGRLADLYKDCGYKTFERTGDIYSLFYENGIRILKAGGNLCFITSNKWMRAGYGEKLRFFFAQNNPRFLIDLGPGVFESATVDTNILLIGKSENKNNLSAVTLSNMDKDKPDISEALRVKGVTLKKLTNESWFIGSSAEQKLKEKIEKIGKPLKDWDVKIYRGVLTGLNEAFIIDSETREKIIAKDPKSSEIVKPILRGRDIKQFGYEWSGLWLLHTGFDIDVPKKYPGVYKHLLKYEKEAKKRDDQGQNWWNLRSCAYYEKFKEEKIVWSDIATEPSFTILPGDIYFVNTVYMIVGAENRYLTGILNSKLMKWYFTLIATDLGEKGNRYFKIFVEALPILQINKENKSIANKIKTIVDEILAIKKKNINENTAQQENQINEMIYELFNFTKQEKDIIRNV